MYMDEKYQLNYHQNAFTMSLYYSMRLLVLLAALLYFWWGEWTSGISIIFIFLLMVIPSILKEKYCLFLPFALDLGIVVLIFITLFLGHMGYFYEDYTLWDKFAHFQSGILLGIAGFVFIYILNENKGIKLGLSPIFISIFSVTFSLSIGAVWEIIEFVGDMYWWTNWQPSNADTMWDLIVTGVGALIVSTLGYFWMLRHKRLPFTPWNIRFKK